MHTFGRIFWNAFIYVFMKLLPLVFVIFSSFICIESQLRETNIRSCRYKVIEHIYILKVYMLRGQNRGHKILDNIINIAYIYIYICSIVFARFISLGKFI